MFGLAQALACIKREIQKDLDFLKFGDLKIGFFEMALKQPHCC